MRGISEHPSWWDSLWRTSHIYDWTGLVEKLAIRREIGNRIVLTNGVFDLLHPGHILKLQAVRRSPSDFVIVSLDTDSSIVAGEKMNEQQISAIAIIAGCSWLLGLIVGLMVGLSLWR